MVFYKKFRVIFASGIFSCRGCWAHPSLTPWSWSMCWYHCHVSNLPNGHGTRASHCPGTFLNFGHYFCPGPVFRAGCRLSLFLELMISLFHPLLIFAECDVSSPIQRNCPCSFNSFSWRRPPGFIQRMASFCYRSCKLPCTCPLIACLGWSTRLLVLVWAWALNYFMMDWIWCQFLLVMGYIRWSIGKTSQFR